MAEFKKRNRLTGSKLTLLLVVAGFFELLQVVFGLIVLVVEAPVTVVVGVATGGLAAPVITSASFAVSALFAALVGFTGSLTIWFLLATVVGVKMSEMRSVGGFVTSSILEWVPAINILPISIIGVIRVAYMVRKADEKYNKTHERTLEALPQRRPRRLYDRASDTRSAPPRVRPSGNLTGDAVTQAVS